MTLQLSGAISFTDIQTIFGGTNPIGMNEYYTNDASGFTTGVSGLPSTGSAISLQQFYGKSKISDLYAFTTHTFTNAGATGRSGPIISQVRTAYSTATWAQNNSYLSMTTQGIQEWTVPATGSYTIVVAGAAGGSSSFGNGGLGAVLTSSINFTKGEIIKILVGQKGAGSSNSGGGGGGTYVIRNNISLFVAGAGGGAGGYTQSSVTQNGVNASLNTSGTDSYQGSGSYFISNGLGGTNGSGGTGGVSHRPGGGGGGYSGNGQTYTGCHGGCGNGEGGVSFTNGGTGGLGEYNDTQFSGGFGGGGGGGLGGGGGGGYSGGGGGVWGGYAAGDWGKGGGGGGTYYPGTVQISSANTGHGYVTITTNFKITEASPLYTFSTHTFTNAVATGRTGPILSQVRTAYSTTAWTQDTTNNYLNMTTQGIQLWTVPVSGSYTITIAGAAGGNYNNITGQSGVGLGCRFDTTVTLFRNDVYGIVVGQRATPATEGNHANGGAGGGGGSFIWKISDSFLLAAAGGGGGRAIDNVDGTTNTLEETYGMNAVTTRQATIFNYNSSKTTYNSYYKADNGNSGGHWTTNGNTGYTTVGGKGWTEMINALDFTGRNIISYGSIPGFGGGSCTNNHCGGGGGGYSGGGSVNYSVFSDLNRSGGGGGSSYSAGAITNIYINGADQGYIIITKI
jgi:hypothetical protein